MWYCRAWQPRVVLMNPKVLLVMPGNRGYCKILKTPPNRFLFQSFSLVQNRSRKIRTDTRQHFSFKSGQSPDGGQNRDRQNPDGRQTLDRIFRKIRTKTRRGQCCPPTSDYISDINIRHKLLKNVLFLQRRGFQTRDLVTEGGSTYSDQIDNRATIIGN